MVQKSFSLKGKRVLITGATGILGRLFCEGLAEAGADIAMIDLNQESLDELSSKLEAQYQVEVFTSVCDISNSEQVNQLFDRVNSEFGEIHVLHNNAATKTADVGNFLEPFESYQPETWDEVMAVNVKGMFLMAQKFGAAMAERGSGSIIQTGSIYGLWGADQSIYKGSEYMGREINTPAVYAASKAGVVGLTQHLAALWGKQGVRVNTLVPGGVFSGQNDEFVKNYSRRVPMGRMARAEEMVAPLIFLASEASSYITGQCLSVDGGLGCW